MSNRLTLMKTLWTYGPPESLNVELTLPQSLHILVFQATGNWSQGIFSVFSLSSQILSNAPVKRHLRAKPFISGRPGVLKTHFLCRLSVIKWRCYTSQMYVVVKPKRRPREPANFGKALFKVIKTAV